MWVDYCYPFPSIQRLSLPIDQCWFLINIFWSKVIVNINATHNFSQTSNLYCSHQFPMKNVTNLHSIEIRFTVKFHTFLTIHNSYKTNYFHHQNWHRLWIIGFLKTHLSYKHMHSVHIQYITNWIILCKDSLVFHWLLFMVTFYLVLGCLRGAAPAAHLRYLGRYIRFPIRPPEEPTG